jgi:hypothetical protein
MDFFVLIMYFAIKNVVKSKGSNTICDLDFEDQCFNLWLKGTRFNKKKFNSK